VDQRFTIGDENEIRTSVLYQRGWIKIRAVFSRRFWFIAILLQNIAPRLDDAWGPGGPESGDDA